MKEEMRYLIETLQNRPSVIFAYLFGSKVKGYANDKSDWDIAVYFAEPIEKVGEWPAFELEAELSRALGATVQVTVLNNSPAPLFGFEIVKDGVLLIDRDENLRMDFENRTLRHYHDWQYFLKRQMEAERNLSHT
jgi:predicted nucleotidyltransferase